MARFLYSYTFQGKKYLEYEYRGKNYCVCAEWNTEPLSWQHRQEQALIDSQLDTVCKATENAEVGFELFLKSIEEE